MTRHIPAPADMAIGSFTPTGPLHPEEIKLGKVIDISVLKPGDLILLSAIDPGFIGDAIRQAQSGGGFLKEDACWEHAAMYVGQGTIVEATRSGVERALLAKFVGSHLIRARRDPALTLNQQYELVMHGLSMRHVPYNFWDILKLWKQSSFGFGSPAKKGLDRLGPQYPKRATICSQFYADAYVTVTSTILGNLRDGTSTPAALSLTATLVDIKLSWLAIHSASIIHLADAIPIKQASG